jgi:hypothetical protein
VPTMFTLPWRWTGKNRPEPTVVFASRFDGAGLRARWRLFVGGIRLRRAVRRSPGALGVSLRAHPFKGVFYTLSMWEDEASLLAFAGGADHQAAVRQVGGLGPVQGILLSRPADGGRPRWKDTLRWLADAEPGPYHRDAPLPQTPGAWAP